MRAEHIRIFGMMMLMGAFFLFFAQSQLTATSKPENISERSQLKGFLKPVKNEKEKSSRPSAHINPIVTVPIVPKPKPPTQAKQQQSEEIKAETKPAGSIYYPEPQASYPDFIANVGPVDLVTNKPEEEIAFNKQFKSRGIHIVVRKRNDG
jgi:hypothetical protein